jgi:tetratricopeptide (TPR) repeat protein
MTAGRKKFRKRGWQPVADRHPLAGTLRGISDCIRHRDYAGGLSRANQWLAGNASSAHHQARVLALAGDSQFKRGAFSEAAQIYLQAAQSCLEHHGLWLRPLLGHVAARLKNGEVDASLMMARHTLAVARQKRAAFDEQVRAASRNVAEEGQAIVPRLPPRTGGVAYRLGSLFLREGELAAAQEFLEAAVEDNPRSSSRARRALARIALAKEDPASALRLANQALRIGKFSAKTIDAWPILIAARRRLGGDMIRQSLLRGLDAAPASVRARAVLTITRELRKSNMRQWRKIAQTWLDREGSDFPIVAVELRKMLLASWKRRDGNTAERRAAAEQLLQSDLLSWNEWLAGAKEQARASLEDNQEQVVRRLIGAAVARFGRGFGPKAKHSMALTCLQAGRPDLARVLLGENLGRVPAHKVIWVKSAWALARFEMQQGRHAESARLFLRIADAPAVSARFRLQARAQWLVELLDAEAVMPDARWKNQIESALADVDNPELLMDVARHFRAVDNVWAQRIFEGAEAMALRQFREAAHPSMAVEILFKLTRRQLNDFRRANKAIEQWERLDAQRRQWLWSENARFWEYLGLVFFAYQGARRDREAESLATSYLSDPATPVEGLVHIGIPYAHWLITEQRRAAEALPLLRRLIRLAPTHALCAEAYYWLSLEARHREDLEVSKTLATRIRTAQRAQGGTIVARRLEAAGRLLVHNLSLDYACPTPGEREAYEDALEKVVMDLRHLEEG